MLIQMSTLLYYHTKRLAAPLIAPTQLNTEKPERLARITCPEPEGSSYG
jgi:hypothetical protein